MRARGFALLDVVMGVALWSLAVLSTGAVLSAAIRSQRAAERRWETLLACRSALEVACMAGEDGDTVLSGSPGIVAWADADTLAGGMVFVTAGASPQDGLPGSHIALSRLVWPGGAR
jgi:hypothetical protein